MITAEEAIARLTQNEMSPEMNNTSAKQMQQETDRANRARLAMLEQVIAGQILIPPKLACYPEIEEVLWRTVQQAFLGEIEIDDALKSMTKQVGAVVRRDVRQISVCRG